MRIQWEICVKCLEHYLAPQKMLAIIIDPISIHNSNSFISFLPQQIYLKYHMALTSLAQRRPGH